MSKLCPTCKQKAKCIDSRNSGETTNRRYHCECGTKFTTCELMVTIDGELASLELSNKRNTTQAQLKALVLKALLVKELSDLRIRG